MRGMALGVFTTYAYAGSFIGGILGGVAYHYLGMIWLGILVALVCVAWLGSLIILENPSKQANLYLSVEQYDATKIKEISDEYGVIEIYVNKTEGVIVLKYNNALLDSVKAQMLADCIKK